ncbi:MAG: FAD-dependent oxidoreductase [Leptospiraceae bacterium]
MNKLGRGDFIKIAILAALFPPGIVEAKGPTKKVLVVGAGMAGLTAAGSLAKAGYDVTVLEARNRIGGRMHTDSSLGMPLDLGAAWVHGASPSNPLTSIVQSLSLKTLVTDADSMALYYDGSEIEDRTYEAIDEATRKLFQRGMRLKDEASIRATMSQVLQFRGSGSTVVDLGVRWHFASEIEIELAADANELSLKYWDEDEAFAGPEWMVGSGFSAIAQYLARGLKIRAGTVVRQISQNRTGVSLETSAGSYQADYAIVTLPLGVLKSGTVQFRPGLSAKKQSSIARMKMGTMKKVALLFSHAFWPPELHRMGLLQKGPFFEFWNMMPLHGRPVLVALTQGAFARELEGKSESFVKDRVLSDLRAMFGKVPDPKGFLRTRWYSDPFSRGAYSMIAAGSSLQDFEILAEPEGRIAFAGEACNPLYPGTLHGALLSGQKAARIIASK